jgi:uncharacterized protein
MAKVHPHLSVDREELGAICGKWQITEMALFGSFARGDFTPDSDVDVMVSFAPESTPSLWRFVDLQEELAPPFGRPVDVIVRGPIRNPYRRRSIQRDLTRICAPNPGRSP